MNATVLDSVEWLTDVDVKATTMNVTLEISLKGAVKDGNLNLQELVSLYERENHQRPPVPVLSLC